MEIKSSTSKVDLSGVPLDRLAASTDISENDKIKTVSKQFEAILLRQFLTEAQKPAFGAKKNEGGMSNTSREIYQDMTVSQLADQITKAGGLGLANSFQVQMIHPSKTTAVQGKTPDPSK